MKLILMLIAGLTFSQAAFANDGFGMDEGYNQSLQIQQQGAAYNSTADGDTEANGTSASAWQDMSYVQNQYAPLGNVQAPIYGSANGAVSTFKGTSGQKINQANLPKGQTGLMAVAGGYTRFACSSMGNGGFKANLAGSRVYNYLPPTSTSTVNFNIVH